MGLGDITKQLAQEAIGNQVKEVVDSLRPPNLAQISEALLSDKPAAQAPPDSISATILKQVQAMQNALKENEELMVLYCNGLETLRVLDFFLPSAQVIVLTGIDSEKNVTRVISPAETLQLTCKVVKAQPPTKPFRIRFITPRP